MAKVMKNATLISLILFILLFAVYCFYPLSWLYSLTITAGTFLYHFAMRLAVGYTVDGILKNNVNYEKKWFSVSKREQSFYKKIKVHKLKKNAPTYSPSTFSIKERTLEQIIMATCQAEIVHETIIVLSFVPLLFSLLFQSFWAFFITSVIAACYDLFFVIIQRYNRPRLVEIFKKTNKKN